VAEYWIVDVGGRSVEVFTHPDRAKRRYRDHRVVRRGTLTPVLLQGIQVAVAPLLRTRR
jgi:hypothetical protein